MKKILLIILILFTTNKSLFGQCQDGIELKVNRTRDWVKDYDKLVKDYSKKKERVSTLKHFFYDGVQPKQCISKADLKTLNVEVQNVFDATPKSDKSVQNFIGGIKSVANANKEEDSNVDSSSETDRTGTSTNIGSGSNIQSLAFKDTVKEIKEENANLPLKKTALEEDKSLWRGVSILFLLLSLIGFGLFAWVYWLYYPNKIRKKNESHKSVLESQSEHFKTKEYEWKSRAGEWEREKKSLDDRIKDLENRKKDHNATSEIEKIGNEQKQDKEHQIGSSNSVIQQPQVSAKQFYLSTPALFSDGKGIFDGSEVGATSISALYHFVLINDKAADFTFLNTPNTVQDALKFPDRYILPACEYTGLNSKATKIITKKPGRAVKEGNNWKVQTKAEIRFE